jgi:hypothetical protein
MDRTGEPHHQGYHRGCVGTESESAKLGKGGQAWADLAAALDSLGEIDDGQNQDDDDQQSDQTVGGNSHWDLRSFGVKLWTESLSTGGPWTKTQNQ